MRNGFPISVSLKPHCQQEQSIILQRVSTKRSLPIQFHLLPQSTCFFIPFLRFLQLPRWEESVAGARNRYATVIQALADRYPNENLLLVSHGQRIFYLFPKAPMIRGPREIDLSSCSFAGEAVGTAVASYLENTMVYEAEYCACCHLRRNTSSSFKVLNDSGQMGVFFFFFNSIAPDFKSC